jgi:hypothetical protein
MSILDRFFVTSRSWIDMCLGNTQETLRKVFRLYVDLIIKNPLQRLGSSVTGAPIATRFNTQVTSLIEETPFFR